MPAKPDPADYPASLQQRLDGLETRLGARRGGAARASPETEVAGVLGMIDSPAVIRDRAGRIVHANDAAARSVGRRSAADLLGTSADALFPPGGRIRVTPVQWCGARCEAVVFEAVAERREAEAEHPLVDAVRHMSDGFLLWDAEDRLVMFNDRFAAKPAERPDLYRLGMTFREFAEGMVRRLWNAGREADLESRLAERVRIHREATGSHEIRLGKDHWVLMTERRTAEGFTVGIYTDISERKRQERALADAERRNALLATVLDQAADAVVVADRRLRIEHVNPAFERMSGRPGAEVLGRPADAYLLPGDGLDASVFHRGVRASLERGEVWEGRARVPSADGSFVEVEALISPVSDRSGAISHYVAIKRDVAERLRFERSLQEAKEAAELGSRAKSEFLANMSHELRTPLNAVIGLSEVLKDEVYGPLGDERYLSFARDIGDSGRNLLRVINDILEMSRIDAGTLSPRPSLFDPRDAIEGAIRAARARREGGDTPIAATLAADLGPVRLDERMFEQILASLLSNACKFTPDGGRIALTARRWRDDGIEMAISDTGIGIADEHIARIFQPFVQLDTALDRRYQGTGLGLPLAKALVDLQGGEIAIESALGKGTTVTVRLPSAPR